METRTIKMKRGVLAAHIFILLSVLLFSGCQKQATTPPIETTPVSTTTVAPEITTSVPSPTPTQVTVPPPTPSPTPTSKTYYVKNGGSDTASGLSDADAWATLSKIQAMRYNPGDKIMLKCGSTWNERLGFPSSGSAGNDIVLSSYGSGVQPKIMRLYISGKSYITVSNIHMLADRDYEALNVNNCNNITIDGITADGQKIMDRTRNRIAAFTFSYNITIRNSTVKDGGNQVGTVWGGGLTMDDGCHDFLVENNLVYNHAEVAIQTGPPTTNNPDYNIIIRGNTVYNEEGYYDDCRGINVGWKSYNIVVENNKVSNTSTMLIGADTDEHDVIIRNNLLFYTIDRGYASFIDILSTSHGDAKHYNTYVYNNSMFHLSRVAGGSFFLIRTLDGSKSTGHKLFNNLCVSYNPNVAFINDTRWDADDPNPPPAEFTSDYNLFYSMIPSGPFIYRGVKYDNIDDWRTASGQDMHSIYANPLLKGIENFNDSVEFTTSGNELMSNSSFNNNAAGWDCYFDSATGAMGSFGRTTSAGEYATAPAGLKVISNTGGSVFSSIQLHNTAGMPIESNKWYVLSFKAKASRPFRMQDIGFTQMGPPFTAYDSRQVGGSPVITTDWQTYHVFFYTSQAASDARITWYLGNSLPAGGTFYIDDISFKLADGLNNSVLPDIEDFVTPINSPCVNAGVAISEVKDDYLGRSRPRGAGYDIGAYECQ